MKVKRTRTFIVPKFFYYYFCHFITFCIFYSKLVQFLPLYKLFNIFPTYFRRKSYRNLELYQELQWFFANQILTLMHFSLFKLKGQYSLYTFFIKFWPYFSVLLAFSFDFFLYSFSNMMIYYNMFLNLSLSQE